MSELDMRQSPASVLASNGMGATDAVTSFRSDAIERQTSRVLGSILLSFAVFAIWPELDLRVSEAFFAPATGFAIDGNPVTEALRMAIWYGAIVLCLGAALGAAFGMAGHQIILPTRAWGYIVALYVLGPGLMVEMLTKPLWGRARPAQIADFGGSLPFSPPNVLVDVCARNCSFVSGEVSGATVTAVTLLLLRLHLKPRLSNGISILLLAAAACLPLAVALQRVAAGRHYLSDTVFAVLFTLLLALSLSFLLRPVSHRPLRPKRKPAAVRAKPS